ncbi:MAG: hypothetical protein M1840_005983 [Geoglossum simile]|nr:MAG: hypothetical protein M1840_005983 [Geoglossum simile]
MPHLPPRAPSRNEDDSDSTGFKMLLLTEKAGDIILPAPPIPDRSLFREPAMEPAQTIFHRGQDYPSSLSDTSEESSSSHSLLDDDELGSPVATTAAAAMGDGETGDDIGDDIGDDVDDSDLFDSLEGCDVDSFEAIDGIEVGTDSLGLLTKGKTSRGAIAVVISYVFVGKPKMVDIPHSPRSSGDSRRWGLPPTSRPSTAQEPPSLGIEHSNNSETRLLPPAPDRSNTTPLPAAEAELLFLAQPHRHPTTTICCSGSTATAKSTWRGLVRSVSRRRKRTPKESVGEALMQPSNEEPEKAVLIGERESDKAQRRPRGLGLKLQMTARLPGGFPTTIMAR